MDSPEYPDQDKWLSQLGNRYLGIRWKDNGRDRTGMDCMGFVIDFYRRSGLGIEIKDPVQILNSKDLKKTKVFVDMYKDDWKPIRSKEAKIGDLLLMSAHGPIIDHVGIVQPHGWFIHSLKNFGVIRSRISGWKPRIRRYLRHVSVGKN